MYHYCSGIMMITRLCKELGKIKYSPSRLVIENWYLRFCCNLGFGACYLRLAGRAKRDWSR